MTLNAGTPETRTYDAWGRLAARAQGGYAAEYGYRYGSRLHTATSNFPSEEDVTFEYRGDGRLHQRTTSASETVYRYGMGWDPLVEEDGSGYVMGAWAMTPGGARGKKLAYMFGGLNGGLPMYAYHDHLGSIRRTRWTNKSSFGRDEFDPYGGLYATEGLAFMLRHFAMHPEDPALQAYRAPYRNYSPAMARWMTRDPLGMVDGTNEYGYVKQNPSRYYDDVGAQASEDLDPKCQAGYTNCKQTGGSVPDCVACLLACLASLGTWPGDPECGPGPGPYDPEKWKPKQPAPKPKPEGAILRFPRLPKWDSPIWPWNWDLPSPPPPPKRWYPLSSCKIPWFEDVE